ncbi:PucR family transcriptional regulator ligand-binding domain-containing protein [Aquibacillus koreensis]|uniref:PucR family transcriptional regulator ligand-binding domain-containing protein n=1 Tax=Aquibacillus koreensis TaxID=279446 RepID=A0A9X3WN28_9BACI|nr:PucR family transcriptional regulator [Aquibacillus koreensis]MCT2537760.1 PucR family transcriptional regulator ligand-binding domain-containing protein [Aquibacillus koreensis]MDC3421206.1 PucR family transcriptional regulator ligand-binding domain-containing protein [Aquibacillus koreensis]
MGLSVCDVVHLQVMNNAKVKAGKNVMDHKQVEWVSVIETPVENFVRKNEFVLSTGIGCESDPEQLENFVRDIIKSGASVLAIATGRYIFDIPDRILQMAAEKDFIIIDLPWEVRFADVLQTVMEKITEVRQGERQKADRVRQQLIDCVLQDKGLKEIAHTIYRHIQIPLAITDQTGELRASRKIDEKELQEYVRTENNDLQLKTPLTDVQFSDHPLYYHMKKCTINDESFFELQIINNHKIQGYLLFQPKQKKMLSWFVMNVLEHALTACALYFVKENAIELTEIRLKDNFVLNLAKQKEQVDHQVLSKGKLLGYDLSKPYICLVGDIEIPNREHESKYDHPDKSSSLQSFNYYVQKEITYAGKLFKKRTMTTFDEDLVIIYLEGGDEAYVETVNQFLDTMERRLSELLTGVVLSWGVATEKQNNFAFYEGYEEARTTMEIGIQQHGRGERTFFEDTKINRLLMNISKKSEIASIVKDTIQPLVDYDKKRQTDLIHTFVIYNKYKGNVSQTARALNLHRQSLLHRLRNIESLTHLSLIDSDDSFLLELSIRLWMLKKLE